MLMLALVSALLCLVVLELVAQFALGRPPRGNITPVPIELRMRPSIPGVPYQLRPDTEVVHFFPSNPRGYFDEQGGVTYRTNALGFRGKETTQAKPPGVFRILGLGDSFTFGTGVRVEDTFLSVTERLLNVRGARPIFEILNLGAMGYDTIHEVALLAHVGRKYDPESNGSERYSEYRWIPDQEKEGHINPFSEERVGPYLLL